MHNVKIWPGGLVDGVSKIAASNLVALDQGVFSSVNGDDGGCWDPSSSIIISGSAGLHPSLPQDEILEFADGDRTFTRIEGSLPALLDGSTGYSDFWISGQPGNSFQKTILVPEGATVTNVRVYVGIKNSHPSLPLFGPGVSVFRPPTASNPKTLQTLNVVDAGLGSGFTLTLPANVGIYNGLGITHFDYVCNRNNVIDDSNYIAVLVNDESGGGAVSGNIFYGFQITYTLDALGPL